MSGEHDVLVQAQLLVDAFIAWHGAPAIPALLAACVGWSVEHGGGDQVRSSLVNAGALASALDADRKRLLD